MQKLIVANWKMNPKTLAEAKRLFREVSEGVKNIKNSEVVICPPFVYLSELIKQHYGMVCSANMSFGAQNVFWEEKGAFTGEISPVMLKSLGVKYVILGHSERRRLGETDEMINKKIKAALEFGLKPILCIASLEQLKKSSKGINKEKITVAFEPISAVGSGKPYNVEKAKKMREAINYPFVLYGGSVNAANAASFIFDAKMHGLLVGQASLSALTFIEIAISSEPS